MIRLFTLKQQKKDGEAAPKNTEKRSSAAQLRISKGKVFLKVNISLIQTY